jgi:molecular chaperone GrpE
VKPRTPDASAAANAPKAEDAPAAAGTAGTAAESPADEAAAKLESLQAELDRAVDARLRAEAELVNARRRALREIEDAERRGAERSLAPVLSVADDLDRALEAAAQAGETDGPLVQGVSLVLSRLLDTLAAEGVTPIVPQGEPFDPRLHEALTHSPHPTIPAESVSQVIARGWRHGERLIRPARVLVSSGPPAGGKG